MRATFAARAGAGKKRHLMRRDEQRPRLVPEQVLRAIAMMHVEIQHRDPPHPVHGRAPVSPRSPPTRTDRTPSRSAARHGARADGRRQRHCPPRPPEPHPPRARPRPPRAGPHRATPATGTYPRPAPRTPLPAAPPAGPQDAPANDSATPPPPPPKAPPSAAAPRTPAPKARAPPPRAARPVPDVPAGITCRRKSSVRNQCRRHRPPASSFSARKYPTAGAGV